MSDDRPWRVTPVWARWLPAQVRADLRSYRYSRHTGRHRFPLRWLALSLAYSLVRPLVIGHIPDVHDEYNCSHCSRPLLRWQCSTCSPRCERDQEAFFAQQEAEQRAGEWS